MKHPLHAAAIMALSLGMFASYGGQRIYDDSDPWRDPPPEPHRPPGQTGPVVDTTPVSKRAKRRIAARAKVRVPS